MLVYNCVYLKDYNSINLLLSEVSTILQHSFIPILEVATLFLGLFYTLNVKPTLNRTFICIVFVFLPLLILFQLGTKWIFTIFLILSTLAIFNFFSKSIRSILDLSFLVLGSNLSEDSAQRLTYFFISNEQYHLYYYTSIYLVAFSLLAFLYKKLISNINPITPLPFKVRLYILFISIFTIIVVYLNTFIRVDPSETIAFRINVALETGYLFMMAILARILYQSIKKHREFQQMTKEQEQQLNYMNSLEKVNKEMRKFQHDYANILLTMRGYLENEDLEGLKNYFQSHILKAEKETLIKNEVLSNLDNLKIVELKGLLATKLMGADQIGIKMNIEIPEVIEAIDMNIIDLTRIIGILTDNAIEACTKLDDGEVHIAFINTHQNSILIGIDNTVDEASINLTDINKENFSTKGDGRGIGLSNVRDLLKSYNNVKMSTQIENGWFMQEIEIPNSQLILHV